MKHFFLILILFVFLLSCQKEIDVPYNSLAGDYEWFYSENGQAFDVSPDQFGVRITKNGRVKLFKNGELEEKYRIIKTSNHISGSVTIQAKNGDDPIYYSLRNDTLTSWNYPNENFLNYYIKNK